MQPLTEKQKRCLTSQVKFWAAHTAHWWVATLFVIITFVIIYTFWGNDAAFAAAVFGEAVQVK